MAKDDYFVVAYQLLGWLYSRLKKGETAASAAELMQFGANIVPSYWMFILRTLSDEGYISGVEYTESFSGPELNTSGVSITVKGIEYLFSNTMMERVKKTLKDIKDIVPYM
ncbi:YjcQ family protein [Lacticaseibacillus songhuajiangensis]|jgi:hypothetical protein|uniref:YjcQ family protein n=1 Tax=Lacticaseibacillus songhuajiangensis TaxID=1296539 RepID=UPI000F78CB0C|nr:YjcQ family protein [Lacticaseibacillus songhuajiangensis]